MRISVPFARTRKWEINDFAYEIAVSDDSPSQEEEQSVIYMGGQEQLFFAFLLTLLEGGGTSFNIKFLTSAFVVNDHLGTAIDSLSDYTESTKGKYT